jgi:hypothetical protein
VLVNPTLTINAQAAAHSRNTARSRTSTTVALRRGIRRPTRADLRDAATRGRRGLQEGRAQVHSAPCRQTEGRGLRLMTGNRKPYYDQHLLPDSTLIDNLLRYQGAAERLLPRHRRTRAPAAPAPRKCRARPPEAHNVTPIASMGLLKLHRRDGPGTRPTSHLF